MNHRLACFFRDTRGTTPERWAIIAGLTGVLCVVSTHVLDMAVRNGAIPALVMRQSAPGTQAVRTGSAASVTSVTQTAAGIDYTVTASIPSISAATHLDPCTGQVKPAEMIR